MAGHPDETDRRGESSRDTSKRHGDKLSAALGAESAGTPQKEKPATGDSPKRQGDPMAKVIGGRGTDR